MSSLFAPLRGRRCGVSPSVVGGPASLCALPVAAAIVCAALSPVAYAAVPLRALLTHKIAPAASGADAVRISVFGDKSGAQLQVRLLAPGQDGVLTGYFAPSTPITVDFEGWKTVTLPLSDFGFHCDVSPEASGDGIGSKDALASATSVQLAVSGANARLYIGELGWTTGAAAPTDPLQTPMDEFIPGGPSTWTAAGDYDQLRAVTFGVNKVVQYTKNGKGSLQIVVRAIALNERQGNAPAINARLKARATQPYAVYVRPPFETISLESVPSVAEYGASPALSLSACPDEFEPTTFAVYSAKDLKNATVKVSGPFKSGAPAPAPAPVAKGKKPAPPKPVAIVGGATLPADAIDVRVVRAGQGVAAPEILMKDDRESLAGPLPKVRLTGDPTTDVPAGASKQFWVTVHVPRNQKPGTYKGNLVFSAPGVKPTTIPMSIEVLDLPLKTAFLQYGIELRSHIGATGAAPGEPVVTADTFAAQLANIRDHGFKLIALSENPTALETELKLYKDAAMSPVGPVVVGAPVRADGDIKAVEGLKSSLGLGPGFDIYYALTREEARTGDASSFGTTVVGANRNALVIAPVETTASYAALSTSLQDPHGERLAPIYPLSSDYSQKLLQQGKRGTPNRDYWSWNIPLQSPIKNRLFTGLLLYKTGPGLYGAFPGPYQYAPGGDPFAAMNAGADAAVPAEATRPQMTTFPVEGGVLDTLQWEAVREGVDDIRYIGVLKGYTRELKDIPNPALKQPVGLAESYLLGTVSKNLMALKPGDYVIFRRTLIQQSFKLKGLLEKQKR